MELETGKANQLKGNDIAIIASGEIMDLILPQIIRGARHRRRLLDMRQLSLRHEASSKSIRNAALLLQ